MYRDAEKGATTSVSGFKMIGIKLRVSRSSNSLFPSLFFSLWTLYTFFSATGSAVYLCLSRGRRVSIRRLTTVYMCIRASIWYSHAEIEERNLGSIYRRLTRDPSPRRSARPRNDQRKRACFRTGQDQDENGDSLRCVRCFFACFTFRLRRGRKRKWTVCITFKMTERSLLFVISRLFLPRPFAEQIMIIFGSHEAIYINVKPNVYFRGYTRPGCISLSLDCNIRDQCKIQFLCPSIPAYPQRLVLLIYIY